jgi:hypothetical protein
MRHPLHSTLTVLSYSGFHAAFEVFGVGACEVAASGLGYRRGREVVMKRFGHTVGSVGFLLLLVAFPLHAQQADVMHNVNLRADPSADNPPIRLLMPPEQVQLLESSKTSGYYHVHTSQAEDGWVWAKNVRVIATSSTPTPTLPVAMATPTPAALPTSTATPTPSGPASTIDETWEKPAPREITYTTVNGRCAPAGKAGSDTPTNLLKNRVDVPTNYHDVTFDAIGTLSYPNDVTKRIHWQPANLTAIARFEGVPLSVVGYLSHAINVEGKEDTNCGYQHPDRTTEVDWHMYLTKQPSRPISESVVVETTPRVRKDHQWNRTTLLTWVDSTNPVRISGWLMLDPDHPNMVGSARRTIWEIHPITKIEVWKSGAWVDLETLP